MVRSITEAVWPGLPRLPSSFDSAAAYIPSAAYQSQPQGIPCDVGFSRDERAIFGSATRYPTGPLPHARFLAEDLRFFLDCLPIVALQYAVSLRFRNFLVPVGFGFMLWVGTLAALSWRWNFLIPYAYPMIEYLKDAGRAKVAAPAIDLHAMAIGYFVLFTLAGYGVFATRQEKG